MRSSALNRAIIGLMGLYLAIIQTFVNKIVEYNFDVLQPQVEDILKAFIARLRSLASFFTYLYWSDKQPQQYAYLQINLLRFGGALTSLY